MLSASLEVARRGIRQHAVNGVPINGKCGACVQGLLANIDRGVAMISLIGGVV
jgi:hypothetical protein